MKSIKLCIVTFSLLFSSNFSFGQVELGTASNFVLFTSAGNFDNIGSSNFVGDIGTNVGAITGFPPGTITGQIQLANPTTTQAAADLEVAYNYVSGVTCDSVIGTALGGGQTLKANVYCISNASTLSGDLILDGENNPNSQFIIKINGILDVTTLSKVILVNSALINNVYWQINGAVNIGDSTIFKGIILANGALNFAAGSVLVGNGLTRQGAISTTGMNASLSTESGMPIELIYFEGKTELSHNLLSWSTGSEMNNSYFTIERSTDGINFIELIRINGVGTCSYTNNYTYSDFDFEKKQNYYRLSQTDYDGKAETLGLISINNLQLPNEQIIKVVNMMGQEVDKEDIGLRMIYFSNGEYLKVFGKYL